MYVSCFTMSAYHKYASCFPAGKYSPCTTTEVSNSTVVYLLYFIITCSQKYKSYYVDHICLSERYLQVMENNNTVCALLWTLSEEKNHITIVLSTVWQCLRQMIV